eukprot:8624601-Pyramimonas_sp.AAC.1
MLRECAELKSTMRSSEAAALLEEDERWSAVESTRERQDLFGDFMVRAPPSPLRGTLAPGNPGCSQHPRFE